MRAMVVDGSGVEPFLLTETDLPQPVPGPDEVLVTVRTSGVNRADRLQRAGKYVQPALLRTGPTVAGMEVVGVIADVGGNVTASGALGAGARVMAMCGGSYAESAVVPAGLIFPVPDDLDDAAAAALPVAMMTAYDALARAGGHTPGESVLITAAASSVGLAAVSAARLLGASRVFGTARSSQGLEAIAAAGGEPVTADDAESVRELTAGKGVDIAVDHVGGAAAATAVMTLARGGRFVSVGRLDGRRVDLDLNHLARERLSLIGTTFRTRSLAEYVEIADGVRQRLLSHVADGTLRVPVSQVRPVAEANDVLDRLQTPRVPGKLVLDVAGRR